MIPTLKGVTAKRYYYETHAWLQTHLADFVTNDDRQLKAFEDLSLYDYMSNIRTGEPDRSRLIQSSKCRD